MFVFSVSLLFSDLLHFYLFSAFCSIVPLQQPVSLPRIVPALRQSLSSSLVHSSYATQELPSLSVFNSIPLPPLESICVSFFPPLLFSNFSHLSPLYDIYLPLSPCSISLLPPLSPANFIFVSFPRFTLLSSFHFPCTSFNILFFPRTPTYLSTYLSLSPFHTTPVFPLSLLFLSFVVNIFLSLFRSCFLRRIERERERERELQASKTEAKLNRGRWTNREGAR